MALYELLLRTSDNPVVALNHAVAVAVVRGARAGLDLLEELEADEWIAGDHRLHAVRAHRLESHGVEVRGVVDHEGSWRSVYFFDPDGLRRQLSEDDRPHGERSVTDWIDQHAPPGRLGPADVGSTRQGRPEGTRG